MGIERLLRRACLSLLLAGPLCLSSATASDLPGLRIVGENGMQLCLDRSTVDSVSIQKNAPFQMSGTEENPTFAVRFEFNDLGADALARLTAANVGETLQYWLNGRLLQEATLRTDILGGVFGIVLHTEAEALAAAAETEKYRCSQNQSASLAAVLSAV